MTMLTNVGQLYAAKGQIDKALQMYEEGLQIDGQLGNLSGKADIYSKIGEIFRGQGKHLDALKYYIEASNINEDIGNLYSKIVNLRDMAVVKMDQGKFSVAIAKLEEALNIAERINEPGDQAALYQHIGVNYIYLRNKSKALKSFKKGITVMKKMGKTEANNPFLRELKSNIDQVKHMR